MLASFEGKIIGTRKQKWNNGGETNYISVIDSKYNKRQMVVKDEETFIYLQALPVEEEIEGNIFIGAKGNIYLNELLV